jgi:ribosome-binding protein aMBF1 (putative translation factor)
MFKMAVESNIGEVVVKTTQRRGLSPEELAERAVEQIVSVSDSVDPIVRQQAEAF